jgi:hypothetical protein
VICPSLAIFSTKDGKPETIFAIVSFPNEAVFGQHDNVDIKEVLRGVLGGIIPILSKPWVSEA